MDRNIRPAAYVGMNGILQYKSMTGGSQFNERYEGVIVDVRLNETTGVTNVTIRLADGRHVTRPLSYLTISDEVSDAKMSAVRAMQELAAYVRREGDDISGADLIEVVCELLLAAGYEYEGVEAGE